MPTISQVIKIRNRRYTNELRNPLRYTGFAFSIVFALFGVMGVSVGLFFAIGVTRNLPSADTLPALLAPPNGALLQPTMIYDRDHEHVLLFLADPATIGKRYLSVGENAGPENDSLSKSLIDATIATFDPGFWKHQGYTTSGWKEGTHSTLAQKLISELVIDDEDESITRNVRERILAAQVTERFGREKVLEWYLNSAQYGDFIYGADAAALAYLGKSASNLSVAEAALLTAISEIPGLNPTTVSPWLKGKQEDVINTMLAQGLISKSQAKKAIEEEIALHPRANVVSLAPAFTSLVLSQLESKISLERIRRGGLEIITTLDYDLQQQSECVSKILISQQQGLGDRTSPNDVVDCRAAQFLPSLNDAETSAVLSANVVILDPKTGQILAMVGDESSGDYPSEPQKHESGTILSPFLYMAAFARGLSPASLLWDIPEKIEPGDASQNPTAEVSSGTFHGPVRARVALLNDYAAASQVVLELAGAENVILTTSRFGIDTAVQDYGSDISLDDYYSQRNSLLEVTTGYAILANQGLMVGQPFGNAQEGSVLSAGSILHVVGVDGKTWLDQTVPETKSITNPQLSYLLTHVLSDESIKEPDQRYLSSLENGQPVADKLGTSPSGQDAWSIGYLPNLAVGVWVGNSINTSGRVSTALPAGLWHAIISYAASARQVQVFNMPEGVVALEVCNPSGLLVTKDCPSVVQEVFLEGNEPGQFDNLYQKLQINRETGLLATIFTSSDKLEEKLFLMVPPDAVEWAKMAGLPIPPDAYDETPGTQAGLEDVQITSPQQYNAINGELRIVGTAAGDDFSYYRLQVGQGLNPHRWIQIGEDVHTPVNNGLLGVWDTTGLEGPFILQLLVVRNDQRFDRVNVQVMIDHAPAEVQILSPGSNESITYREGERLMLQASAVDASGVERVEFFLDGEMISRLIQSPYVILWSAQLGEHTFQVKAYDRAGNVGDSRITFFIKR